MDPLLGLAMAGALVLSYANGANDVARSVATLIGSGTTNYSRGLLWGALWTGLGATLAAWLASRMLRTFVSDWFVAGSAADPAFSVAVAVAALGWVLFSNRRGVPVSTTHSLVGAIVGLGVVLGGSAGIAWSRVIAKVIVPLAASPFLAVGAAWLMLPQLQKVASPDRELVLRVAMRKAAVVTPVAVGARPDTVARQMLPASAPLPGGDSCGYVPTFLRANASRLHWISSAAIAFARALNDTPKIAAISAFAFLGSSGRDAVPVVTFVLLAASMFAGSVLSGLRVTRRMAECITRLDDASGLTANLFTAFLVAGAANLGLPVSTTHVSTGAIVGVGLAHGVKAVSWATLREFVLAWTVTLPATAALALAAYTLLSWIGGI